MVDEGQEGLSWESLKSLVLNYTSKIIDTKSSPFQKGVFFKLIFGPKKITLSMLNIRNLKDRVSHFKLTPFAAWNFFFFFCIQKSVLKTPFFETSL